MPLVFKIFLVLAALLAAQSVISLRDGYRFLEYLRRSLRSPRPDFYPLAAVMVPVKGLDENLASHVESILGQQYPSYSLTFAVASESDPAHPYLAKRLLEPTPAPGRGPCEVKLVVAGATRQRGEKVNNLLAALRAVPRAAEVLVFADADARPKPDWLCSLIAPLANPAVTVSTGFRWYLPGLAFASRLRAAWDASVATLLGEHHHNFAWGGSMAIRAVDFQRLGVAERYWAATVSDDYGLMRAVRDAGGWIRFEPKCLVASSEEINLRQFLRWSNRQIIITRVYAPRLWAWGLVSHALFCGTLLTGLCAVLHSGPLSERVLTLVLEAALFLPGLGKARLRARLAREVFHEEAALLRRYGSCYWQLWPLVPWLMLVNFLTAGLTRRIEWRGIHYELISPDQMRVLGPGK